MIYSSLWGLKMVKVYEAKDWGNITHRKAAGWKTHDMFYIRVQTDSQLYMIAEKLNLKFLIRKGRELICCDGKFVYWYKP